MQGPFGAIAPACFLAALVALSGCIQIEDTASRALCLKLSASSEPGVPDCPSQEECLQKAEKSLFQFDQENFSYALRQKLSSLKGHVALSWLFLNKAKANLKKVNAMCLSRAYAGLPTEVNDFKYNSLSAAQETDKAVLDSFAALLISASDLEAQKPELLKEEQLYNDFSSLRSAISDLKGKSPSGNSFPSKYFAVSSRLQETEKRLGLSENAHYVTLLGALDYYDNPLLEKYSKDDFYLRLLSNSSSLVVSYFSSFEKLKEGSRLLGENPSQEVFSILSGVVGTSSSVMSEFSRTFSALSSHYAEAIAKKESVRGEAIALVSSAAAQAETLSGTSFSGQDKNAFLSLYLTLEGPSEIRLKLRELEPESFAVQARSKASLLRQGLGLLGEKEFLKAISLGEHLSGLKEIRLEALRLKSEMDYYSTEIVAGLHELCESRSSSALKEASSDKARQSQTLSDLASRVEFRVGKMRSAGGTGDYFAACASFAREWKEFRDALESQEKFREGRLDELRGCLAFASEEPTPSTSQLEMLSDSELASALQKCLSRKSELVSEYGNSAQAREISSALSESAHDLGMLKALSGSGVSAVSESDLSAYSTELEGLSERVSGGGMPRSLSLLPELSKELLGAREELGRKLSLSLREFVERNAVVSVSSPSPLVAGRENAFSVRVFVPNPFSAEVKSNFAAGIQAKGIPENARAEFKSAGIISAEPKAGAITAEFSGIAAEGERMEFGFSSSPAEFSEELEALYVSSENAVIESRLSLSGVSAQGAMLLPMRAFAQGTLDFSRTRAFSKGMELETISDSNSNHVLLQGPEEGQRVSIYYFVLRPISAEQRLESQRDEGPNSLWNYSVRLESRIPFELENFLYMLPVETAPEGSEIRGIIDSFGRRPELVMLSEEKPAIRIKSLAPGQGITVYFTLLVSSAGNYWKSMEAEAAQAISELSSSENSEIAGKAAELRQRLELALLGGSGKKLEGGLLEISAAARKLRESEKDFSALSSAFLAVRQRAVAAMESLSAKSSQAASSGFPSLAASLSAQSKKIGGALEKADLASKDDLEDATGILLRALPSLSGEDPIARQILSDKNSLVSRSLGLLSDFRRISVVPPISEQEFLSVGGKIDYALSILDFSSAAGALNELKSSSELLEKGLAGKAFEMLSSQRARAQSFSDLVDGVIPGKLSETERILSKANENELEELHYFSPVSQRYLKQARDRLALISSASFRQRLSGLLEGSKDSVSALEKINALMPELGDRLASANSLEEELESKISAVKEDSEAFFAQASSAARASPSREASQLLLLARQALDKKDWLNSIAISKKAVGLASLPGNAGNEGLPVAVYPLLLVILTAVVARARKGKGKEQQSPARKLERAQPK